MFTAEATAHNMKQIECEPRPIATLTSGDIRDLMEQVSTLAWMFADKGGLKGFNLTVTIKEDRV